MKIVFDIRGFEAGADLLRQVTDDLEAVGRQMAGCSVEVALHLQSEVTPACQVVVGLSTGGVDLHAAARDHGWPAAWRKVLARLLEQVADRGQVEPGPRSARRDPGCSGGPRRTDWKPGPGRKPPLSS